MAPSTLDSFSVLERAEARLWETARLTPGWSGAVSRPEARALLNELSRLRALGSGATGAQPSAAPTFHGEAGSNGRPASTTTTAERSSQDSELKLLRVRVGVLEGALREALPLIANDVRGYTAALHADEVRRRVRAVLAGGEAAGQGEEES